MSNPNPFGTQILSWFATSSSSILKSTSSNVISILNIESNNVLLHTLCSSFHRVRDVDVWKEDMFTIGY